MTMTWALSSLMLAPSGGAGNLILAVAFHGPEASSAAVRPADISQNAAMRNRQRNFFISHLIGTFPMAINRTGRLHRLTIKSDARTGLNWDLCYVRPPLSEK